MRIDLYEAAKNMQPTISWAVRRPLAMLFIGVACIELLGDVSTLCFQCPLDDVGPFLNQRTDRHSDFSRQHIGNPNQPATSFALGEHLHRGVMMLG